MSGESSAPFDPQGSTISATHPSLHGIDMESLSAKISAPLMYEVHELLEKERTLMELRMLDQQLDAEDWREKYETLKSNVVQGMLAQREEEQFEAMDQLGEMQEEQEEDEDDVDKTHQKGLAAKFSTTERLSSKEDVNAILLTRIDDHYADLSDLSLSPAVCESLLKILFGVRSEYDEVCVLNMRNTESGVDSLPYLLQALRNPRLKALDLSKNDIDNMTLGEMMIVLRKRKVTPQYFLINGNNALASHAKLCADLVEILTFHTWGLAVSLQDILNNPREVAAELFKQQGNKVKKDPSLTYRALAKNPLGAFHFLAALNGKISKAQTKEAFELGLTAKSEKKKSKDTAKLGIDGKLEARTVNVFEGLSALALTEHSLAKETIEALGQTLHLLRETLTDLDLSFSFVGYRGALVISDALHQPESQLVKLNLRANSLGDSGASLIADALKVFVH